MSERLPEPHPLDQFELHGRTVNEWLAYLGRDGDLSVPCSRYGRSTSEVAPWAVACEYVYTEANGENSDESAAEAIEFYMGLAVNDHDDVLTLVREYWYAVPKPLRDLLEYNEEGLTMAQHVALSGLCQRYNVAFSSEHYAPQFDLPDGYVAGWIGGAPGTLYVGCSEDGEVSS